MMPIYRYVDAVPQGPRGLLKHCLIDSTDPEDLIQISIKVTRVSGSTDSLSSLRVSQRLFAHHGASEMGFYRLSMPVECAAVLTSPVGGVLPVASNSVAPSSGGFPSSVLLLHLEKR